MKADANTPITLTVSLGAANQIISALNAKVNETVGILNSVQQQASTQVAALDPDFVPSKPDAG